MLKPEFKYEAYSQWSRLIASKETKEVIEKEIFKLEGKRNILATSHLKAVVSSTSMQSNSQRRAQAGNALRGNWERLNAYRNALELYEYYPEKCKHYDHPRS
jgi:hypothetical protein